MWRCLISDDNVRMMMIFMSDDDYKRVALQYWLQEIGMALFSFQCPVEKLQWLQNLLILP